jgi:lysophospholipase L1-like esterase
LSDPGHADHRCRLGVLAFGDSITNGGGELQWGVALQSWALWVARSLGLAYTGYAVDAARVSHVVNDQIPAFIARFAWPEGRFEVGCLYVGVNDVRSLDWDPVAFETDFRTALSFVCQRSDRTLAVTAPLRLGLPPTGAKVLELNAVVRRVAEEFGALVVDLCVFGGRNLVMADQVHPTALGQIAIAERALARLESDGLAARVVPASLIRYEITRGRRLRADWTYVYRTGKMRLRAAAATAWLRLVTRSSRPPR